MAQELSFEQIDAHIAGADLSKYQAGGSHFFATADVANDAGGVLQKICSIYQVIRPILVVISKFPLIPTTWKAAVTTFISLADSLCPAGN